ncbi:hypothetical protein CC1G_15017 [Coprinopsis cinerea okayama7|uniref:Uncharacterized protein n=1 Tax=Coprinopsis cinerea (strain Okayama-7 / 130 / ATCC MYA-4618 / FGSC 9003) TaxID=240176 RepID=D6RP69_COPC7|nr:hypothetical protein CC1G_15017 [Coprinopsis cinerea okayama7\|eukprot:XP_002910686.1 hypothetical protein CC1G_15017 [Coprinopsis cinerea okayama7\
MRGPDAQACRSAGAPRAIISIPQHLALSLRASMAKQERRGRSKKRERDARDASKTMNWDCQSHKSCFSKQRDVEARDIHRVSEFCVNQEPEGSAAPNPELEVYRGDNKSPAMFRRFRPQKVGDENGILDLKGR